MNIWTVFGVGGNRDLRRLLESFAAFTFAEWTLVTAVAVHAYRSDGILAVGLIGFRLFPAAIASFVIAPFVDRHRRSSLLASVATGRAALMMAIGVLFTLHASLAIVVVLIAADAVLSSPYRPAQTALIPSIGRSPSELVGAAAGTSMVKTISQTAGAAAGALLSTVWAVNSITFGAAGTMAIAALTVAAIRCSPPKRLDPPQPLRSQFRSTTSMLGHPFVAPLILSSGLRCLVRGLWSALLVATALHYLKLGPAGVGKLTAAAGIGALCAVPITARFIGRRRLGWATAMSFFFSGACISLIGIFGSEISAVALLVGWGTAMALADSTSFSMLYRMLTPGELAPTVGVLEAVKLALEGIGAILTPLLVYLLGIRGALLVGGVPLVTAIPLSFGRLQGGDRLGAGRSERVRLLYGQPLFTSAGLTMLEDLASRVQNEEFPSGSVVIREMDFGDKYYVLVEGTVSVSMGGYPIGELGPGSGFGERALLRNERRFATITAITPISVLSLERDDFLMAVQGDGLAPVAASASPDEVRRSYPVKEAWELPSLAEALGHSTLFSQLNGLALQELARAATVEEWSCGTEVITQGGRGDSFHVILEGLASIRVNGKTIGELRPGDTFGEIALLHDVPRTATVTALTDMKTCTLNQVAFLSAVDGHFSTDHLTRLVT
jgi:CRP-like cAMP-binding protein